MTKKSTKKQDGLSSLSYEDALDQLETLIDQIESGEVGLEESLSYYENGTKLVRRCRDILDTAEKRIAELTQNDDGGLSVQGDLDDED